MEEAKERVTKSNWPRALTSLGHRDYRVLWAATFVSNAGSWMQKVATAWLIYQITGSAAWLGVDAFASGIPTVLLLPWGGVLSDRVSRRTLLITTNLVSALLAALLASLQAVHVLHVWHIVAVSALSGIVQAVMVPASTSLLPSLVGKDDVANAVALNSMQFNLSRVIGPAVGGLILVYLGAAWNFALNALSFLVLVVAFVFIRQVPPVDAGKGTVGESLSAGVTFIRRNATVAAPLLMVFLAAFFGAPIVSMLPAFVKALLHREATSYSVLLSLFGAGAVVAAALLAIVDRRLAGKQWTSFSLITFGAIEVALALSESYSAAIALTFIAGALFVGSMVRLGTTLLLATPDEFRGRVSSVQQMAFRSGQPLGALSAGGMAHALGIKAAFVLFGAALIASIGAMMVRDSNTGDGLK